MGTAPAAGMTLRYQPGFRAALDDLLQGARLWRSWWLLSWQQVRSQYRRTVLGPWWISLQRAIFFGGLSFLFGILMEQDLRTFIPFVAVGFTAFQFLTTAINGGATVITGNAGKLKASSLPLSVLAYRQVSVNLIQFAHDAVVLVIVLVALETPLTVSMTLLPVAFLLLLANALAFALWLGPLNARFRDVGPLVTSITGILFFFTPIFWRMDSVSTDERTLLTGWNPLTYLVEAFRSTILGEAAATHIWIGAVLVTVINCLIAGITYARTRLELVYWVQT